MAHARRFRFGIQASGPTDAAGWRELAGKVEDLGYSTLTVADHLDDQFAPVPALMAAADATSTLRIGALVFANDFRHPVVLAKEAATIDQLSGGRFELGMGAGWMTTDYEASGIHRDRASRRIDRLDEAITVVKALLGLDPVDFMGTHYRIQGLQGTPPPVQRPHPPILVGGGGPRILAVAARQADIVAVNVDLRAGVIDERAGPSATAEATRAKLDLIADAAGPRFDELELHTRIHLALVTDDRDTAADELGPAFGVTGEQALASPHALAGTTDQIVETLQARRAEFGISYIGLGAEVMDTMAPVVARLTGR